MCMPACASALAGLRLPPWTTHHRAPSSASRPTSGYHTAQGVSRGARVAVRCQGSHHTAVQRPTTRPSCWSLLLLPAATDAHCSPATPSQLTQGRHRAVRSARDVPGSVDPAGMAKWGREGARSLNCRIYVCLIKFPPERKVKFAGSKRNAPKTATVVRKQTGFNPCCCSRAGKQIAVPPCAVVHLASSRCPGVLCDREAARAHSAAVGRHQTR